MQNCTDLRRAKAAEYLKERHNITVSAAHLAKLAVYGGGPPFCKDGRFPLYSTDDLDAWAFKRKGPRTCTTAERARIYPSRDSSRSNRGVAPSDDER